MTAVDVNLKNTKNEILDAYHEVLGQLKEAKKVSKQEVKYEQEKQQIVEHASKNTAEEIIKNLAALKLSVVSSLEALSNQLLEEHKKLPELQQAIEIQRKELEDLYEIKVNTDTLAALIQAQKQKRDSFEKEMEEQRQAFEQEIFQKRSAWKKEQETTENLKKEQEIHQQKIRQREEDEYLYKRDSDRQKERDQYETQKQLMEKELTDKKTFLEKEFSEREAIILAKEQEFQSLKSQIEEFPSKLQKAVEETEKTIKERLEFKYDYEAKLAQKEIEGERNLYQQKIFALESAIAQQEKLIRELTEKANHAGMQVQEIAVKAIDGAARQRAYPAYQEKLAEMAKA